MRDKAYRELLKKIPDAKVSSDPWGSRAQPGTAQDRRFRKWTKTATKTGAGASASGGGRWIVCRERYIEPVVTGFGVATWPFARAIWQTGWPAAVSRMTAICARPSPCRASEARTTARDFLTRFPKAAYMSGVERWRELPGGDIEFTMRRLRSAD